MLLITVMANCSGAKGSNDNTEAAAEEQIVLNFSGERARKLVEKQVGFGPRIPGTTAHAATAKWLEEEMRGYGMKVTVQNAELTTFDKVKIPITNLYGQLNPEKEERVLVIAHWDTRPWADEDPDPAKREDPVPGADDGASGVAVALELARVLGKNKELKQGFDILLVDAEDWGTEGNDESWAMGTRYFTENLPDSVWKEPRAAIVVDMVGDRDATFRKEYFSMEAAPGLVRQIWSIANELGYGSIFPDEPGGAVTDDHLPLIEMGIRAIDIVDYRTEPKQGFAPQWHTTEDTADKISAGTLEAVGRSLERFVISNQ